jgi:DNA-binding CsgD family transcriptional regulator
LAARFSRLDVLVLVAAIAPFVSLRRYARNEIEKHADFFEIFVRASIQTCSTRDPKQLYKRARAGALQDFTGVQQRYEEPESPDLVVDTEFERVSKSCSRIVDFLVEKRAISEWSPRPINGPDGRYKFTRRECEIIDLVCGGMSNKQIAAALTIEISTVKNHLHHILQKANVRSRLELERVLRSLPDPVDRSRVTDDLLSTQA